VGQWVEVKVYAHRLEVFDPQGQVLARHPRHHSREQYYIQLEHYLKTLAQKPGALIRSTAWHQADPRLHTLFEEHFREQPKIFIELLLWARKEQISIDQVLLAAAQAQQCMLAGDLSLEHIQLLATGLMKPQLHQPQPNPPQDDPIARCAAEQLAQAQALLHSIS
jgi:hypothetical protein